MTTLAKGFNFLFTRVRHYSKLICNMKPTQRIGGEKLVTQSKVIVAPQTRNKLIWIIPGF